MRFLDVRRWLLVTLVLPFCPAGVLAGETAKQPNIVFLLIDDLGYTDVGFNGGDIKTPHIDRLAAAGARLAAFYVQPVCSPTRAALMTGRYPMRQGLQVGVVRPWAQYGLPLEERTLAQALKTAGYRTAIVGKWHLGHFQRAYLPTMRGFDHQYGHYNGALDYFTHERDGGFDWHRDDQVCRDQGYTTVLLGNEAVRLIEGHDTARPLFLYVPFNAPHSPMQALPEHLKLYEHVKDRTRQAYCAMVHCVDEQIGRIVAALEKHGMSGDTIILFSSDNGGPIQLGATNGRLRAGKGSLYEGGVRAAAFVTWPGKIKAGQTIAEPLHMVDWYPTLLKRARAAPEQKLPVDGKDIWSVLTEGRPSPHEDILINVTPRRGALRMGNWKLVLNGQLPDEGAPKKAVAAKELIELFDLSVDPSEKTNLASQQPERVRELRTRLEAYGRQAVPPKVAPKPKDFKSPKVWGETDVVGRAGADHWERFRGPNGTGTSDDKDIPLTFGANENMIWKVALPGTGNSSPVVWGKHLFLQAASNDGKLRSLLCLDTADGNIRWQRSIPAEPAKIRADSSLASSTPATDGKAVYVALWDGKDILVSAYDFQGDALWSKNLGTFNSQHGPGASPILYRDKLILANDMDKDDFNTKVPNARPSMVVALDKRTGRLVWETPRVAERACYSAPFLLHRPGQQEPELVVTSTTAVTGYNVEAGAKLWEVRGWQEHAVKVPMRTVASPALAGDILCVCSGGDGGRFAIGLAVPGFGNTIVSQRLWENRKDFPYVPSPVARGEHIYFVNDAGFAGCYHARTGKRVWFERLADTGFHASPLVIDGKVFATSIAGDVYVFAAEPAFRLLAHNELGEVVRASAAVADARLYIRGERHLYCIGKNR